MVYAEFETIHVPDTPSPNFVKVSNISPKADEKIVKDFFLFCGLLKQFELARDRQSVDDTQFALIEFEKPSAAKTARLFSGAQIIDRPIQVLPLWKEINLDEVEPTQEKESSTTHQPEKESAILSQEDKPKLHIVAEVLAYGFLLSDQIINKAKEWDARYGVSEKFKYYTGEISGKTSEYLGMYGIQEPLDRAKQAVQSRYEQTKEQVSNIAKKVGETDIGKFTQETYESTLRKGQKLQDEALEIKQKKEQQAARTD